MSRTRLNTNQLDTIGNTNIATDAELTASISAHVGAPDPHEQYRDLWYYWCR